MRIHRFVFLISLVILTSAQLSGQRIYTVNASDDVDDGVCDAAHCSLREAINDANLDLMPSEIRFAIGMGQATIFLQNALPRLTEEGTTIDGMTQNGAMGGLRIDCSGIGVQTQDILSIFADDTEIYGLELFDYTVSENGMMEGAGSMIGIGGIFIAASPTNVIIGAPNRGNIIHSIQKTRTTNANFANGIGIHSGGNIEIQGNIIGTDLNQTQSLDIWGEGIRIDETQFGTTYIGGENPGEGNVIVGSNRGIGLFGGEGWVKGNSIGLTPVADLPNRSDGIILNLGDFYEIGGTRPQEGNTVANNGNHGISVNTLVTCYIGYNDIFDNNPNANGISMTSCPDCIIENNRSVGHLNGIFVDDNGFTSVRIFRNQVGYNIDDGVQTNYPPNATDIVISQNSHYCNGRGIGVGIKGPGTIFDPLIVNNSSNTGCNGISSPNAIIELFIGQSDLCPDAFCQGVTYLASTQADGVGNWSFNLPLAPGIYTCTQTLPQRLTSPFSACFEIMECSTIVTNNNDAGPGSLREAILCANSTPGLDTISFDIPGVMDHVISPTSVLPAITGPTMIDATTQPAGRVIVDGSLAGPFISGLQFEADTSSLFGLHMRQWSGTNVVFGSNSNFLSEITVGQPGKGNYLYEGGIDLHVYAQENVSIQSNILGMPDNYQVGTNPSNYGCQLEVNGQSRNVLFGGERSQDEENVIVHTSIAGVQVKSTEDSQSPRIFGNYFGTDTSETEVWPNCLARSGQHGALHLTSIGGAWVGDGTEDRQNTFAFNLRSAIHVVFVENYIRYNSFYCNEEAIDLNSLGQMGNLNKPAPAINMATVDRMEGTSIPGDSVEVYLHGSNRCPDAPCQGRFLLGKTQADGSGRWSLAAPFLRGVQSMDQITALAYDIDENTSPFSECVEVCPEAIITATNGGPYCPGDVIELFGTISTMGVNTNFTWTGPNGYSSNQQNPTDAMDEGVYQLTVEQDGCTYPTAETTVVIGRVDSISLDTTICTGDFLQIGSELFDVNRPSGEVVLTNSENCDSVVMVNLNFDDGFESVFTDTLCPNEFVDFRGQRFDIDNPTGGDTLMNRLGCDSIYSIQLFFHQESYTLIDDQLCFGDSVIINGVTYNENNSMGMDTLTNIFGCDSILDIQLSFGGARVTDIDTQICAGGFVLINGKRYDERNPTGVDTIVGGGSGGCDSILNISVTTLPQALLRIDTILCDGRFLEFNNIRYDQFYPAGNDTLFGQSANGCDSIISVNLSFFEPEFIIDSISPTCAGKDDGAIIIEEINGIIGPFSLRFNGIGPLVVDTLPFVISNLDEGNYLVVIEDSRDCRHDFQIELIEEGSIDVQVTSPVTIASGESTTLTYTTPFTPDSVFWILNGDTLCMDCPEITVDPVVNSTYELWVYQGGCSTMRTIDVLIDVNISFYLPNAFTPDGNNINDWFNGYGASEGVVISRMEIYSRWGEQIYVGENIVPGTASGWDGTFNGEELPPGVFVFNVEITFPDGFVERRLGEITLIR